MTSSPPPKHIAIVLFPGFQLLDITGPLDVLNTLSRSTPLNLSILAATLDPVSTHIPGHAPYLESLTPSSPPKRHRHVDYTGGFGSRSEENIEGVIEFGMKNLPLSSSLFSSFLLHSQSTTLPAPQSTH
ncbi:hypothetical protein GRF29_28g1379511 [Pseudopithomyces chartarum]|uniref:DJ-1/PfpI domain-containing protein n=1 Tax=Pseudopithomyces chartarum TaxID=1892770 RepID=A0AAN6M0B5_9PLEO|nr:hypothetical protein GRF29_28g1379511 [Pseudopithomyces chartarum]